VCSEVGWFDERRPVVIGRCSPLRRMHHRLCCTVVCELSGGKLSLCEGNIKGTLHCRVEPQTSAVMHGAGLREPERSLIHVPHPATSDLWRSSTSSSFQDSRCAFQCLSCLLKIQFRGSLCHLPPSQIHISFIGLCPKGGRQARSLKAKTVVSDTLPLAIMLKACARTSYFMVRTP
jgi:hypothetical protein